MSTENNVKKIRPLVLEKKNYEYRNKSTYKLHFLARSAYQGSDVEKKTDIFVLAALLQLKRCPLEHWSKISS